MKCSHCGSETAETDVRCDACGAEIAADDQTLATVPDLPKSEGVSRTAHSPVEAPTVYVSREEQVSASAGLAPSGSAPSGSASSSSSSRSGITVELEPHTTFAGRYEILQLVGRGGMGLVYKARDLELDKVIALKTIRSESMSDPDIVKRFKREILLARKVTHRNVVRIHDIGEADGLKFITMEYVEGESLKQLIRRKGALEPEQAIPIARNILAALDEAHGEDVIHRDLKPQNVVVDRDGIARIMDFGIARSNLDTAMTATGVMIGTPDYMSPEQVRGETAGAASDLFSFGVILFEMLTGDLPFHGDTPMSKVMMRLTSKPRIPKEVSRKIPAYLERIVLKCMEVDPALRYESVSEILRDLDRQQVDRSLTVSIRRAMRERRSWVAALGATAVLASVWFLAGRSDRADRADRADTTEGAATGTDVQEPVTQLAILPLTNAANAAELEWLRAGLPEMLITDLSQSRYVRPVPGERVLKVMRDLGISEHTRFDEAALDSLAERTSADSVLYGQFVRSSGALRLDLTLRRSGSGVPIPVQVEGNVDDVFGLVDRITASVKENLDLTAGQIRGDTDRPVAEVSTASAEALRDYQEGLASMRKGETQEAIPKLRAATEADPSFAMAYAKLAEAYWDAQEEREARTAMERAQTLAAAESFPLLERYQIHASAALISHDYDRAVESYQELARLYPDDPDIHLNLANAFEEIGQIPDAGDAYRRVIELAPDYGAALLGLGRVQVMMGQPQEAVRSLTAAVDSGAFSGDEQALGMIHLIIGVAHREMGDFDAALSEMEKSLEHRTNAGDKSGQAATLSNIGDLYKFGGNVAKAVEAQQKALAIARELGDKEGESNYLVALGMTYHVGEDLDKALDAFRSSLQIELERQDAVNLANRLNKIADIYRRKGQYEDAIVYLEQARGHLEKTDEPREKAFNFSYLGLVRKAQGLYGQAVEAYLKALPLFQEIHYPTGVAYTHQDLAEIYAAQGRYSDAREALRQALTIHTEIGIAHEIAEVKTPLAHLMIELGRIDEAATLLKEAAAGGEGDGHGGHGGHGGPSPQTLFGLGAIADLEGREEEAAKAYEDANYQANVLGLKETAVESRIQLGLLYLRQGKTENAERLLERTKAEAASSRLRALEVKASAALARVLLAKKDGEGARKAAIDAIDGAESFSGRPVLYEAYASLGDALVLLERREEAVGAYAKAAAAFDWIRESLKPDDAESFRRHPEVKSFVQRIVKALRTGGRSEEAQRLNDWLLEGPPAP